MNRSKQSVSYAQKGGTNHHRNTPASNPPSASAYDRPQVIPAPSLQILVASALDSRSLVDIDQKSTDKAVRLEVEIDLRIRQRPCDQLRPKASAFRSFHSRSATLTPLDGGSTSSEVSRPLPNDFDRSSS